MKQRHRFLPLYLVAGDLLAFVLALWLTLYVRYRQIPTGDLFGRHLEPFAIIFGIWLIVFLIADLYRHPSILHKQLSRTVINAEVANSIIAVTFFYLIPYFGITPKITLFIDLIFTAILIFIWRRYLTFILPRGRKEKMLLLCSGPEVAEIEQAIKENDSYNISLLDPNKIENSDRLRDVTVVLNPYDQATGKYLSDFYKMIFRGTRFISVYDLYEEFFDRIPISIINERWFLENVSNQPKPFYDFFKRAMDVVLGICLGFFSLIFYPFIYLAIKLDDGGPIFYSQERIGKNDKVFRIHKFRSMTLAGDRVTKFGLFLRKTRLDELPQLFSVVVGNQSLVGPRPEMPAYVKEYREQVPYYDARHLIAPGLSGWAQIYHQGHPHFEAQTEATKTKLSYDLYYVKHRSIWLDITIALKTVKILLSAVGK